ncbi:MAG TPA: hypothetical protein VN203_16175 [Candidatus Acidoferrum sp.]|nr:hypothetical protein [Candidatus Acidoferrum sp.]
MMAKSLRNRVWTVVLFVLGLLCLGLAIYYFVTPAGSLASFVPGHDAGSTHNHTEHGLALLGVAVVCWIGAWLTTAPDRGAQRLQD